MESFHYLLDALVRVSFTDEDGWYEMSFVPDGTYYVFAVKEILVAGIEIQIPGFYDANGDGMADEVEVAGSESVEDVDLMVEIPAEEVHFEAVRVVGEPDALRFGRLDLPRLHWFLHVPQ